MRWPVMPPDCSDMSQHAGGPMISGRSILLRSQPEPSEIIGVSVGPPGTTTLAVTGLPSNSFAHTADMDSSAALAAP